MVALLEDFAPAEVTIRRLGGKTLNGSAGSFPGTVASGPVAGSIPPRPDRVIPDRPTRYDAASFPPLSPHHPHHPAPRPSVAERLNRPAL